MPKNLQADRLLRVTTPLGPDVLLLRGLSASEGISQLFHYQLELAYDLELEAEIGKIPFERLLGQTIVVELALGNESTRYFTGICSRFGQSGRDSSFKYFQMEVVPQLWMLTRKAQSRIFQRLSVPDILRQVFTGLTTEFQLTGNYEPRDYCVQYRETDFNFASRLMEEEGIFYFFRHSNGSHTLVLGDDTTVYDPLPGMPTVTFEDSDVGNRQADRILEWEKSQELRPGKYTLWDHTFEQPHKHLEASAEIQQSVVAGTIPHTLKIGNNSLLEIYDFPGEYAQRFDGIDKMGGDQSSELQKIHTDNERTVGIRMQEETTPALTIRGSGYCRYLASGYKFSLTNNDDCDGDYTITTVNHRAQVGGDYRSDMGDETQYSNNFTCIPLGLPYRPRRTTPKPVVHGTQTAVVVGPAGEEIFPDKYSRVKVQFHWDRQGKNDPDSSCWVRVGTPWAGKNWGMIHIPRIGQEVIVAFEEGDPDRPIIVGSVYNADMMPPYDLPDNKTQSGILSRSTMNGSPDNFNQLRFEDKKDSEEINFHAERDFNRIVENNDTLKVGFDKKSCGDQSIEIFNNQTVKIGTPTSPDGSQTITVYKDVNEELKTGNRTVKIDMGNDSLTISMGNQTTTISMGNQSTKLDLGSSTTEAMQSIELKVGQSSIKLDQMGVTIKGMMISVEGQVQTEVKGLMTQISGDAMLKMSGGITMIN
jgi:type VI secretion system secreted protein VgrG